MFLLKRLAAVGVLLVTMTAVSWGQAGPETYRVFDGEGKATTLGEVIKAGSGAEAVFLGENHDDKVAHALQLAIFRGIAEQAAGRKVALSLEMFERDTQTVLDEYLEGIITEPQFLAATRPWENYKGDYRPLVELAKAKGWPVIAANAPRRYVNLVARKGREALEALSPVAKGWLPPLPYPAASEAYAQKFNGLMGMAGGHGGNRMLDSQALWDATMGHSVAEFLERNKDGLVVQLNGRFHTESRLGTVEMLEKYRPGTKVLVVSLVPDGEFPKLNEKLKGTADFVIVTKAP